MSVELLDSGVGQMRNLLSILTKFSGAHMEDYESFYSYSLRFSAKAGFKTLFLASGGIRYLRREW